MDNLKVQDDLEKKRIFISSFFNLLSLSYVINIYVDSTHLAPCWV